MRGAAVRLPRRGVEWSAAPAMRGAAVRLPCRHCWVVVLLAAALRAAHLQPRRRCAPSTTSPPFLLQSLAVHQRLPTLEVAFSHIITLIGRRAYWPGFTAFYAYRARNEWVHEYN